jgi:hypothetical protein
MAASLIGVREASALAFGREMHRIVQAHDTESWRRVFPALSALHTRPYLYHDGRLDGAVAHPLADFEYHLPPMPDDHLVLSAEAVPDGALDDLEWLLMHAVLLSCNTRTTMNTERFAYVWSEEIAKDELAIAAEGHEEFKALSAWLFHHSAPPPDDLWFLRTASHLHSYVPPDDVANLAELEESAGLLRQLASRYEATDNGYLQDLGRDLTCLRHFLGLVHARREAAFLCYGVE